MIKGMSPADWFVISLCVQYAIAAVWYGMEGQPWKVLYWIAAAMLNLAVIKMK